MPDKFEQGILYVSAEFQTAGHLCACGCGNKVWTPIKPAEWSFTIDTKGPSLKPSIGNGQLNCKSHYIIRNGKILWLNPITDEDTEFDLAAANFRRKKYYNNLYPKQGIFNKIMNWLKSLLKATSEE